MWDSPRVDNTSTFATSRVRLQRVQDGVTFWGWLRGQGTQEATIRIDHDVQELAEGEYVLQVMSGTRVASTHCAIREVLGQDVVLTLLGETKVTAPVTPPRSRVGAIHAILSTAERDAVVQILDASDTGAGILSPICLPLGHAVQLEVKTELGSVHVKGETRYCRPARELGQFRVGVQFDTSDARNIHLWSHVVHQGGDQGQRRAA